MANGWKTIFLSVIILIGPVYKDLQSLNSLVFLTFGILAFLDFQERSWQSRNVELTSNLMFYKSLDSLTLYLKGVGINVLKTS